MRTRTKVAAAALAVTLGLGGAVLAGPALAEQEGATEVWFNLEGGELAITVPGTRDLGVVEAGVGTITRSLHTVEVTDKRASAAPDWTVSVTSSDFTIGAGSADGTRISSDNVRYWSGAATATTGTGTFTPGQLTSADSVSFSSGVVAFSHTGGTGINSASWDPTLIVSIPGTSIVGEYTGIITHSVA